MPSSNREQAIPATVDLLKFNGVMLDAGLSVAEMAAIEARFGFRFPPDLRALLDSVLPVGDSFPNWRSGSEQDLRRRLAWPFEGIVFDIENNGFWCDNWGPKPLAITEAIKVASGHVRAASKLIPIMGHRYIPDDPPIEGNPVYSVYQTDIIVYGIDLWDYFRREFQPDWQNGAVSQLKNSSSLWDVLAA